jgi:hypothetical protein
VILASPERVAAVRTAAAAIAPDVLALTERIAGVPSPTGEEGAKSRLVAELYGAEGLASAPDAIGDVVATLPC